MSRVNSVLLRGPGKGNAYGHEHAPGQQGDFVPPGQEGGSTPPGQNEDFTPPGQAWKPAGFSQEESNHTLLLLAAYDEWSGGWSPLDFIYAGNGGSNGGDNGAQGHGAPGGDNGNSGGNGNGGGNGNSGDSGNGNSGGGNGHGNEGNNRNGNGQDNGQGNGKANGQDNGKGNGQGSDKGGNNGKALGHQDRFKAPPKPEYLTETLYFVNDLADPLAHVAAAYDDSGSYTMMNVWDPVSGSLLRSGSGEETQWALTDALGSITCLVSNPASTGKMDWHATYDEFGQPMSGRKFDPSFPQGTSYFGFTGEPYDFVSGLTYLRNRYYAPALGRFTSPDPLGAVLGDASSLNGYGYVMNNPLKWVDRWGLGPMDNSSLSDTVVDAGADSQGETAAQVGTDLTGMDLLACGVVSKDTPPTREDGYIPDKDGPVWSRERKGWKDKYGNIWKPAPEGSGVDHGGPHWDVERGDGKGYTNVYPRGRRRGGRGKQPYLPPIPSGNNAVSVVAEGAAAVGVGYAVYRVLRLLPSLLPPLWWTLPANVIAP